MHTGSRRAQAPVEPTAAPCLHRPGYGEESDTIGEDDRVVRAPTAAKLPPCVHDHGSWSSAADGQLSQASIQVKKCHPFAVWRKERLAASAFGTRHPHRVRLFQVTHPEPAPRDIRETGTVGRNRDRPCGWRSGEPVGTTLKRTTGRCLARSASTPANHPSTAAAMIAAIPSVAHTAARRDDGATV